VLTFKAVVHEALPRRKEEWVRLDARTWRLSELDDLFVHPVENVVHVRIEAAPAAAPRCGVV